MSETEHIAVANFRTYLRIKTVQPKPDYESCTAFLKKMAEELDLGVKVFECVPGKPIVILTLTGQDPSLPSILLNSHTDVVPVFEESWNWDPFGAEKVKDEDGKYRIYARGSQDMKIVGLLYLEAIRELQQNGFKPLRTLHLSFVPDEEIGGVDGMEKFVHTEEFKALNIGLSLDEGIANPNNAYRVFYGERTAWKVKLRATGNTGHGSQFIENLATDKLLRIIKKFNDFRESQLNILKGDTNKQLGEVTTLNLNMIEGGVQFNVVPKVVEAVFDIRIATDVNLDEFQKKLEGFAKEEGVEFSFEQYFGGAANTSIHPDYPWWKALTKACGQFGVDIEPEVFPAATDSRFLRQINVPAYGVSPLKNLPILLHDHNEYVLEDTVLEGLEFYKILIPLVANEPAF